MATYLGLLTMMAGVYLLLHGLYSHAHRRAIGAATSPWRRARLSNRILSSLTFGAACAGRSRHRVRPPRRPIA
ncbi:MULTISPECIES: hypothetical protein [unclassified Lysobacter]|uniref:hypothetical protein n=1 Tax=unclassified Lysobacter TaxID=2635362 RepID=UPI001BE8937A|nr:MULTISPECIES: hypothetical protein [unclassified Lysobacter]MBT2747717.1 hypothetical protein [Lysobacter sp. ISL-42]MBT2754035.1 hypothetical protein [Lysobacter sp. ISL-50]MBT2779686.1 hypothetical protein [Lysobacter sp. ISL-54]MBT2780135.1 hypothetical protein [Lysobacter sp. ISL-52]